MNQQRTSDSFVYLMWLAEIIIGAYEIFAYGFSLGSSYLIYTRWGGTSLWSKGALLTLCIFISAFLFLCLIVLTNKLLPSLPPGRYQLSDPELRCWFLSANLTAIMYRSPFWPFLTSYSWTRYLFFRGMGATIHKSFFAGHGTTITDPAGIVVGPHVMIGVQAIIFAHKRERLTLTYKPVTIEAGALIGVRAIIFPGARIGADAIVGAGAMILTDAVVPPGVVVHSGEVWAGDPAQKVQWAERLRDR